MAQEVRSARRVVEDARVVLNTIREEEAEGRRPYISDVRRLVEGGLALRYPEYIQFLEKYGFLTLDRRSNLLTVTRAGEEFAEGDEARARALSADAAFHFGDRLPAPGPAPTAVRGERLDHRFLRLGRIGRGGLGTVYRGQHLAVDRPVAIKILEGLLEVFRPDQHDEVVRRVELAVREHARLVSPFIVQILDQNPGHTPPYFVMELAPGGDMRRLLANGPLPPVAAVRYFLQVALGLKVAHAEGVIHRDLKPENVLLDAQGNVKLADFGITRVVERDGTRLRQAYIGYGSVGYMAPELFRPGGTPGPAVDLYALGILLYEMLTGELPGRRSPMPSEVAEGVPADLDEIFDRMTQDSPEKRYGSVDELLTAIWTSESICALLDARQAPWFVEAPVVLPGLLADPASDSQPPGALSSGERPAVSAPPASRPESSARASEPKAPEPKAPRAPEPRAPEPRATEPQPRAPEPQPRAPEPRATEPQPRAPEPQPRAPEPQPRAPEPRASEPQARAALAPTPPARGVISSAPPAAALAGADSAVLSPLRRDETTPPPAIIPPPSRSHFVEDDAADSEPAFRPDLRGGGDPFGSISEPPTSVGPAPRAPGSGPGGAVSAVPVARAVAIAAAFEPAEPVESAGPGPDDSLVDGPDAVFFGENAEGESAADADELSVDEVLDIIDEDLGDIRTSTQVTRLRNGDAATRKAIADKLEKLKGR